MNPDTEKKLEAMTEEEAFAAGFADDGMPGGDPGAGADPVAGSATGDEPPPLPAGENDQAGQGIDNGENGGQPASQDDWLATLPEDIRNRFSEQVEANRHLQAELAKARNDHAGMAGKLKPLQQKLSQTEYQLRQATAGQATPPAPAAPVPGGPSSAGSPAAIETPEFLEWKQTFPEEAKVWEAQQKAIMVAAEKIAEERVGQAVARLTGRYDPILTQVEQGHRETARAQAISQLEAVHPDWRQHSESEQFSGWFNDTYLPSLSADMQRAFEDPAAVARALSEPKYAARVLTEFKRDSGFPATPPAGGSGEEPPRAPAAPSGNAAGANARLALASAPNVGASPPRGSIRIDAMTPEQAFLAGLNSSDP
jgi:hypothetical protein